MKRQFSYGQKIVVTAVLFDARCKSIPTRINWRGRSYKIDASQATELLAFCADNKYFWLQRNGKNWDIVQPV